METPGEVVVRWGSDLSHVVRGVTGKKEGWELIVH